MERFYKKGLLTTLIGLGILLFTGVLMYQQKYSAVDLSGYIMVGILFLRSKDSLIGLGKKDDNQDAEF